MEERCCASCGARGVKLWRPYGCCLQPEDIRCGPCAMTSNCRVGEIQPDGSHVHKGGATLEIGWLVPLVEDLDGSVWGYGAESPACVEAWHRWRELPGTR